MKLSKEEVQNIAKLARLSLSEAEVEKFQTQLSSVLEYMEILNEVDIEGVQPTSQVTGLEDVYRPDAQQRCDEQTRKKIISQFPENDGDALVVPPVFE